MSLITVHAAAAVENNDDFHLARLLLLLRANSGRSNKPVDGITKLAKMDFLLRYPSCLARVLADRKPKDAPVVSDNERNTIEAQMIRYRYGPWDGRYRKWIGLLVAKGLATTYLEGKTVCVQLTDAGQALATHLMTLDEFQPLAQRSTSVARAVGDFSSSKLMKYVYELFPEIVNMKMGQPIKL